MKNIRQIATKELSVFFSSLAAYIFFGVFVAATLFIFFWADPFFARNTADMRPIFEWMPILLIFLVSALTMRMWSEERRSGTIEFLLTSPVSNIELILGKFVACLALVIIALALTLPIPISISAIGPLDLGPVVGGYIASIFLAAAYTAIGLFISSRTDNQIVSLILSTLVCGCFVLIGSDSLTGFFVTQVSEILKLLGSGSRFQSITRGVIDFRDLYYYMSVTGMFLSLNVLGLEKFRWAGNKNNSRHKVWTILTALSVANFIAGNFWLQQIGNARVDLTEGRIYSVSKVTRNYLASLKEPLLIRAYFSKKTHPFLAPLVPRMRDLLKEYAIAGNGKVRLEFVDPLDNPNVEREAIENYGIHPVTFQTASKYQQALTTSYFDILVKYGDQFETLGYKDLITTKSMGEKNISVDLKNPEYDITRCIKKVIFAYQSSGNPFLDIDKKIKFVAYVSADKVLPPYLIEAKNNYKAILEKLKAKSNGKFSYEFIDPDANGGAVANRIASTYGFRPIPRGTSADTFWFYVTLETDDRLVAMQIPREPSKDTLERDLKSGIKRFSRAFIKTVGVYSPQIGDLMSSEGDYRKFYTMLTKKLQGSHSVVPVQLEDGTVPDQIDLLLLLAPHKLNKKGLFAVDQFLMKGGTVILTSGAFDVSINKPPPKARKDETGMEDWLKHYGIELEDAMVLDPQDFPFILPEQRAVSGIQVNASELVAYPPFADIRKDGMNSDGAITAGLNQVTLTWPSPIKLDPNKNKGLKVTRLLQSSPQSWSTKSDMIVPYFTDKQKLGFPEGTDKGRKLLGVVLEGSLSSYFKGKKSPLTTDDNEKDKKSGDANKNESKNNESKDNESKTLSDIIVKSPESARIILFSSSSFVGDRVLFLEGAGLGTVYDSPLELLDNAIDWSLEDRELLSIRGRGKFARTLMSLTPAGTMIFEYGNYLMAIGGIFVVWFVREQYQRDNRKRHEKLLQIATTKAATPPPPPPTPQPSKQEVSL